MFPGSRGFLLTRNHCWILSFRERENTMQLSKAVLFRYSISLSHFPSMTTLILQHYTWPCMIIKNRTISFVDPKRKYGRCFLRPKSRALELLACSRQLQTCLSSSQCLISWFRAHWKHLLLYSSCLLPIQSADCVILKAEVPVHSPMVSFCAGPAVVYSLEFAGIPRYIARHSWILADLQQIYMVLVFIPNCFPISVVSAIVRFLHLSRIPGLRINLLFFNGSIIYKHLSCFTSVD